jgi:threonine/homoserine/homoserine lactone efflux protein
MIPATEALMIPAAQLLTIVGVVLLGAMSPGPDLAVLLRRSATSGRRAGLRCAAGMGTGIVVWVLAVGGGVAALLAASTVAFTIVKLAGAAYLILLGLRAWLSLRQGPPPPEPSARRGGGPFREGLLCNLLNPKVAVFYLALLPQFLPAGGGAVVTLELAAVAAATVTAWYVLVAVLVASMRRLLASDRAHRIVDAVMGTVLIGVGIRVATT